ncbi:MAG: prepilin-type N-terminal cleavage/methylation domain-containing protein [Candidatus Acidiferrum sp.]
MMTSHSRTKLAGFTLIELMIAMGVTMVLLYAAVSVFRDASNSNLVVTQAADMGENFRAGLNMMQLDLQQVGSGIPTGGINIPYTAPCGTTPAINRPALTTGMTFPYPGATCESTIPAVEPGSMMGPAITAPDATAGTPANPNSITDEITMMYADNAAGLDGLPVNQPATPGPPASPGCPNGKLVLSGTTLTVTLDPTCLNLANNPNNVQINTGDLIMFSNTLGNTLMYVSAVNTSANTITFSQGDPFDLNGRTETGGTIKQLQSGGVFPVTLATRIWMISYYLDNVSSPPYIRLIRQVNFNPPTPVGETLENLQFTYNFIDGATNPSNQVSVPTGNSESNIRSVNVYLGARGARPVWQGNKSIYARTNLMTQVSLRSLAAVNRYK